VGQSVPLVIPLEAGNMSERVDVVAAAVLLDTNAVSSAASPRFIQFVTRFNF
jgi:hypothetical protein